MRRQFSDRVRSVANRLGVDIYRFPMLNDEGFVRARIMKERGTDVLLDVGANVGQYASEVRRWGYAGKIVSFEPVTSAFTKLVVQARKDPRWEGRQVALGAEPGTAQINLADTLSSLLPKSAQASDALEFEFRGAETIRVVRLDDIRAELYGPANRVWLKLDVQGFEMPALSGATAALREVDAVELELSLQPLYEGQVRWREMIEFLDRNGFEVWSLHPGSRHGRTGRLAEMNGIFARG